MTSTERRTMRRTFLDAWAKAEAGQPLGPVETQIVQVARMHPQYHQALTDGGSLERDFDPDSGTPNPFLHMALHIAILDQLSIGRPAGIRRLHQHLVSAVGDLHEAEHRLMECLAHGLWHAQHDNKPFNDKAYLKCIKRADRGLRPR